MTENQPAGPGTELKATREGMEVSTREVADALNLPAHVIEALEADDYERLPPSVFTRGYLRSYARLLELEPDPLLAAYPEVTEEVDVVTGESAVTAIPRAASNQAIGIAVGIGVVIILLLVWLLGGEEAENTSPVEASADPILLDEPSANESSAEETLTDESPTAEVLQGEAPQGEAPQGEAPQGGVAQGEEASTSQLPVSAAEVVETPSDQPTTSVDETVTPARTVPARPAPAVVASERASAEDAEAMPVPITPSRLDRRITEFGDDVLILVFSEDCWVEVKSIDGENLYSDLNRTGRTLTLTGRAPFRVLLGYAPGVTLSFNGETVPLERHSRNNVANMVLGE